MNATALIINPTATVSLVVHCRVRGRGPVEIELPVGDGVDADVTRSLLELLLRGAGALVPVDTSPELVDELAEAGLLIAPQDSPRPDPDYSCALSPALLPKETQTFALSPVEPLEATETRSDAPDEVALADVVARVAPTLWAKDPGPQTWMPYCLDDTSKQVLDAIHAGAPMPGHVRPADLSSLTLAHIMGRPGFAATRRSDWQRNVDDARQQVADESYAVFRDFLHPVELAAMREYFRALKDAEAFVPGDSQVEQRDWMHDEPLTRFLHRRLLTTINQITPEKLQPSYSYTARYHPGAVLRRHTDRPQCEWNASLVIDTSPEVEREQAWPIYLEPPRGPTAVLLGMGDFVLYRGTRIPHWREAQPAGRTTTVCFFHFVGEDFIGPLA